MVMVQWLVCWPCKPSITGSRPSAPPLIPPDGQTLQVVDKFTYLGSTLSREAHMDVEVNTRIAKASEVETQHLG